MSDPALRAVREAIAALEDIAEATTHYPSSPPGFRGEWRDLAALASKALASPALAPFTEEPA